MSLSSEQEAFRAAIHVGLDSAQSTGTILFRVQPRTFRHNGRETKNAYAVTVPQQRVSQADLCRKLSRANGKYSASEYDMLIKDIVDAIAIELRSGNSVNLPNLGLLTTSIGGAFSPDGRSDSDLHPVRVKLRVASALNHFVNRGVSLKRVDARPACIEVGELLLSSAMSPEAGAYDCPPLVAKAVRPLADRLLIGGRFRYLPKNYTVRLQELRPSGSAPLGDATEVPANYKTAPDRSDRISELLEADTSAVARRFLPGTRWRLTAPAESSPDGVLEFTVSDIPRRA